VTFAPVKIYFSGVCYIKKLTRDKVRPTSSVSKNKSHMSLVARAIFIMGGILFPLLSIEFAAHWLPGLIPAEIRAVFQNEQQQALKGLTVDDELGYKYAPHLHNFPVPFEADQGQGTYPISTVSLGYPEAGFRDDGIQGKPFTIVIGDSYASCASVVMEACWVEILEKQRGQDWANLGVVGYSPQQELSMLTKYGLPLQPKQVVWVFFANDLDDAWRFDQFGTGGFKQGKFWQNPLQAWLARNSALYQIGAFFWYNRYLFYNFAKADDTSSPHDSNMVWWLTHTNLELAEVIEGLYLTQHAILTAQQHTQAAGAEFMVVILPFREQVYAPATLQPQLDRLNQRLAEFCRQHQLHCLDLTPALRKKALAEKDLIYFRKDIHFNTRGNELVAELLDQALRAEDVKTGQ
jgi:hypothetical protein